MSCSRLCLIMQMNQRHVLFSKDQREYSHVLFSFVIIIILYEEENPHYWTKSNLLISTLLLTELLRKLNLQNVIDDRARRVH